MAARNVPYSSLKAGIPKRGTEKAAEPDRFYILGRAEAALAQREKELARAALEVLLLRRSVDEQMAQLQALQAQVMGLLAATAPAMRSIMGQPAMALPQLPVEGGMPAAPPSVGPPPLPVEPAMMPGEVPPGVGLPPIPPGGGLPLPG